MERPKPKRRNQITSICDCLGGTVDEERPAGGWVFAERWFRPRRRQNHGLRHGGRLRLIHSSWHGREGRLRWLKGGRIVVRLGLQFGQLGLATSTSSSAGA